MGLPRSAASTRSPAAGPPDGRSARPMPVEKPAVPRQNLSRAAHVAHPIRLLTFCHMVVIASLVGTALAIMVGALGFGLARGTVTESEQEQIDREFERIVRRLDLPS